MHSTILAKSCLYFERQLTLTLLLPLETALMNS